MLKVRDERLKEPQVLGTLWLEKTYKVNPIRAPALLLLHLSDVENP